ncbi:ribokinase [Aquipuribacter sp. SD81]|uniref:ribokinase n=1 Tax=Aquipuribacter sp. SD81 TaxID=3127703 RepID=UPI0030194384
MSGRVVVVGSANVDLVLPVARVPRAGETVLATGPARRHPGGKGLNQAVAAARAGAEVTFVGAVGDDDGGRWLRAVLADEGATTDHVLVADAPTGAAHVLVQDDGDNAIVVVPGANATVTALPGPALAALAGAPVVLVQLEVGSALVADTLGHARDAGACVVLNAAPATPEATDLLADVDVLVVNEHEALALRPGSPGVREAARRLVRSGGDGRPRDVVVTLGAAGALLCSRDGRELTVAAPPADVVDTTGAGDAAVGHLAAGLAAGRGLEEALRRACAAGSLAVRTAGAVPSLPDAAAVDRLLAGAERPGR